MSLQIEVTKPQQALTVQSRSRRIVIECPDDGSPYKLTVTRQHKVLDEADNTVKEFQRIDAIAREYPLNGAGLDQTEVAIIEDLRTKIDQYATADGEAAAVAALI